MIYDGFEAQWGSAMSLTYVDTIRPKFRNVDIACMAPRGVKLSDATWMCDPAGNHGYPDHGNARRVYAELCRGAMPPGHKWSQDWLDEYQNWMTGGFRSGLSNE